MSRGKRLLINTLLLTVSAFLMRTVGMSFQVYLSNIIGASGIGLFQLIMSVSMLAATFSISGVRFATTRLVSEELGKSQHGGVKAAVHRCLLYALFFGTAAMLALYFGAHHIGSVWIRDARTVLSLRLLAFSLPAFALGAVLSGYFTAVTRIIKSAVVQALEQVIRIGVIVVFLNLSTNSSLEYSCAIVVCGGVVGEFAAFIMLFSLYLLDSRQYTADRQHSPGISKRLLSLALPLAFSAYARTALSTLENLLVPRGLQKSGASGEKALATYGMIQGMVFPIIAFPSAFFYSLAELIVPELTEAQVTGRTGDIRDIVGRLLYFCILFSFGVTVAVYCFSDMLGLCVYKSSVVGLYIRLLALLMPVIFLDSVTDGMLRGLGQQLYSMAFNILDSSISVILVWFLLPKYAVGGYILMIYFTDLFNFILSIRRLYRVTHFRLPIANIIKAAIFAVGSVNLALVLLRLFHIPLTPDGISIASHFAVSFTIYGTLLIICRCIGRTDLSWLKGHISLDSETTCL